MSGPAGGGGGGGPGGGENGCCGGEALGSEKRTPLCALGRALGGGAFPNLDLGSHEEVCRRGQRFTAEGENQHPLQRVPSLHQPHDPGEITGA